MRFGIARPLSRLILAANTNPILVLHGLNAAYGPVRVLDGISLEVHEGECLALLGANGAGKTSLLRALTGILVRRSGQIVFCGTNIAALRSHEIVRLGIAHIAEGKHLFGPLSVADNLELGALAVSASRHDEVARARALVYELFPQLRDRQQQPARTLSGGEQQMLAIGRAIMGLPKLLLLDEPSSGLAPMIVEHLFEVLGTFKRLGLTIIVAEQNVELGLRYADRGAVLHLGRLAMTAPKVELEHCPEIARLYLGAD
jgi:branched-chain amino acid transport system ATP-binding protein